MRFVYVILKLNLSREKKVSRWFLTLLDGHRGISFHFYDCHKKNTILKVNIGIRLGVMAYNVLDEVKEKVKKRCYLPYLFLK